MKERYYIILLFFSCFISISVYSQSLSVNMDFLNDYYRRQQLLGKIDPSISFTYRPLSSESLNVNNIYDPENSQSSFFNNSRFNGRFNFHKGKGIFQLLPISLLNQYNSHHPEGINDGSMIPSKGTQMRISAGFYFKYGPLSIRLKPEFVYAQNLDFNGFPSGHTTITGIIFPSNPNNNRIDLPERFGTDSYNKMFWGQSSVRLNFGPASFGISNENIYWGPGYKNSLLMTNSAPGFLHLTLNTVRPIKTFIGSFEGQIIAGKLENSGYRKDLPNDWRYFNGMILSFQPKWIPGLFLGITRSFVVYREDMGSSFGDYLPVFIPLSKEASGTNEEVNQKRRNQLLSIFLRWLFIESKSEVYFEYGRNDHAWNLRDAILEPAHSSAFIIGFRKLFILKKGEETYLQLNIEVTNLAHNKTTINRFVDKARESWYTHGKIKYGYTNVGQVFGAGIGPGSNLQTLQLSWNQGLRQIGIEFERYVHNKDFWYNYIKDFRSNWVDISTTLFANWDYKNFLLFGKMKFVKSYNYQWLYEPIYEDVPEFWAPTKKTFNFHAQVGITYRF